MKLPAALFTFFTDLSKNNNREWFTEHKSEFKALEAQVKVFGNTLSERLNVHDSIDRFKLFRIYRDVRFSKDKTPFKTHFGLTWHRTKPALRGGYYLHLAPNNNFLACGFWDPNPADLMRIRKEWELDAASFREVVDSPDFKNVWGSLQGNTLKTAPRGFDKQHPDVDLLRYKQLIFSISFTNKEVASSDFMDTVQYALQSARPFVDYMSEVLTTDLNGESLL
jgi:uncharacterized protein (TIGR02453 family)